VNDDGIVLGWLSKEAIESAAGTTVEEAMEPGPSTFRPNVPLEEMRDYMLKHKMTRALVTSSDGRLIGAVELSEIDQAIHEAEDTPRPKRYV
jgi:CBS domain-containing protein